MPVEWIQGVAESDDLKCHEVDVRGEIATKLDDWCLVVFVF